MIDFMGKKKIYFAISISLVVITLLFSLIFGVELDIQFKGGSIVTYSYTGDLDVNAVASTIEDTIGEQISIQKTEGEYNSMIVTLTEANSMTLESQQKMTAVLTETYPDNNFTLVSSSNVNASMGKEFFAKCLVAVVAASLLIIIYVGIRFRKIGGISAGAMGIIALMHDALMVFATFVIFRIPLDDNFIAVVLTILGFSINDTIVIYDRIRENEKLYSGKMKLSEIVNLSINQSMSRSINTSGCGLLVMVVVCVVAIINNVPSILTFAFPMVIGMISGVYSTICIAGPLWVVWKNYRAKAAGDKPRTKSSGSGKIKI